MIEVQASGSSTLNWIGDWRVDQSDILQGAKHFREEQLDLSLRWLAPFDLIDGAARGLIYDIAELEQIPETPGIYVFGRVERGHVSPAYIGKAGNLRRRVAQQLKQNVKLMHSLDGPPRGYRTLHVAEFVAKRGQSVPEAISIIESALISAALVEGYVLVNTKGTKTLVHTIESRGNKEARTWLPSDSIKLRKA